MAQTVGNTMKTGKSWSYQLRGESWSTPALFDATGDGVFDVITACRAGWVYAISGRTGNEIWSVSAGSEITASPTVVNVGKDDDPRVFIGSHDGAMYCLDALTGTEHWKFQTEDYIRTRPAIADIDDDGRLELIFAGYGGHVYCCDALTGDVKWHRLLPPMRWLRADTRGMVSSPLVVESFDSGNAVVLVGVRTNRFFALDAASGRVLWFVSMLSGSDASPSVATIDGQSIAIVGSGESLNGGGGKTVYALDVKTGRSKWTCRARGGMDGAPTIADINGDGRAEAFVTSLADASLYALRVEDGSLIWRYSIEETDACAHQKDNWCIPTGERSYHTARAICKSYNSPLIVDSGTEAGR
ncbi:MAG: PQQ-like beta-propeller repeat protein, partial [SAR202 cluster bacterium]|nr:PQQ-like beta-propeller repeat protein [SAR202 cluster bacterium]